MSSPTLLKILIEDPMRAIEGAKQEVKLGEGTGSGSNLADYLVGMEDTPEGWKKQAEKALDYTMKWVVAANVDNCVVLSCNEDEKNPVEFKWR